MAEAKEICAKISCVNKTNENLAFLTGEDEEGLLEEASFFDMLRPPLLRKRTLILCGSWFALVLVWYALMFGLQDFGPDVRISYIISNFIEIPGILFFFLTLDIL